MIYRFSVYKKDKRCATGRKLVKSDSAKLTESQVQLALKAIRDDFSEEDYEIVYEPVIETEK